MNKGFGCVAAVAVVLFVSGSARAQSVTFIEYGGQAGDNRISFQRVGVQRGAGSYAYRFNEMILPTISAINVPGSFRTLVMSHGSFTQAPNGFLRDQYINTGMWTPGVGNGTAFTASQEWTWLTFDRPVVNSAGPDLLVFSLDFPQLATNPSSYILSTGTASYTDTTAADWVGSASESVPYYGYDGGATSPSDFLTKTPFQSGGLGNDEFDTHWVLQMVDLSSLGIGANQSVTSLYLQDNAANGNGFFPQMVVGLPAVPEPAGLGLLAVAGAGLLARRGRRGR
jgi:hypothetical protein